MTNTVLTLLSRARLDEEYSSGYWRDDTIYQLARHHAQARADKVAVRDRSGLIPYADLVARADALAERFAEAGLRAGNRVAVWLTSRIETAIAFLACSRNGYVCCPSLHRDHTVAGVIELMQRMRAVGFVGETGYGADGASRDIFAKLGEVPTLRLAFKLGRVGDPAASPLPETKAGDAAISTDPNIVSYLAFTSGTTGRPKGVMHSDNTLLANARAMIDDWKFDATSVIYTMSPLSHNLGLGSLVMAIAIGGELVIHDVPRGASVLDRIVDVGATFIVGVPHPCHGPARRDQGTGREGTGDREGLPHFRRGRAQGAGCGTAPPRHRAAKRLRHDGSRIASLYPRRRRSRDDRADLRSVLRQLRGEDLVA